MLLLCSSVGKVEMRKGVRKWDEVMGMKKNTKRKHMKNRGLGGGKCGRDRMF